MNKNRKLLAIILAVILLAAFMAGCGDSKTPEQSASQAAPASSGAAATAPEESAEEMDIKTTLVLIAPITGNNKQYGDAYKNAVELAVKNFNAAGGLNGKDVKLEIYDDKSDQKEAINVANLIVDNDDVFAVIGSFGSAVSMAMAPTLEKAQIPFFSPNTSHPDFPSLGDMMFPLSPVATLEMTAMSQMAYKDFDGKDLAILYQNSDQGLTSAETFGNVYKEQGGNVVLTETFNPGGSKDFSPLLSKVKQENAGVLFCSANYDDAAQIVLQANQLGLNDLTIICQGQSVVPEFLNLLGDKGEGVLAGGTTPSYDPDIVANAGYPQNMVDFVEDFNSTYPDFPCNGYASCAYDAAMIAMNANKTVGSEPYALLEQARKLDIELVSGTNMRFEDEKTFLKDVFVYIIKDQQFTVYEMNK